MKIVFNNSAVPFVLNSNPISDIYRQVYSHLQHVDIPFRDWDNPYRTHDSAKKIVDVGMELGITVDESRCRNSDQTYLNSLHEIYERRYNGDPRWLDYHEQIHLCEAPRYHLFTIDYREKSGLLEKKFNIDWLNHSTTCVKAGDVFVQWSELGKIPYTYWNDHEPNEQNRINELAKPWLKLRPKIVIALEDCDFLANKNTQEFEKWWATYHDNWVDHWGLEKWDLADMWSVLVFGHVESNDLTNLIKLLKNGRSPTRVMP